ncbi:hypothetical protein OS175_09970 [Marinicella sp. S1101]|uniref:sodium:calcium antiporter n=1 Tax=Marinicella marina TaxID=2996016 RepID=UPI002260FF11|nr:hypothetical protein [Marinicella marina]MCX7554205.1 hypothetical protein [Marinicella marina]MDJ1141102.1 hypothetical protein [Marinicella marina]
MIDALLLITAVGILGWSSLITINASVKLAQIYQLSDLFVGMVILAIGSDLPELVVAISASLDSLAGKDMSGIIFGTSIGSAYTQIGFVLGFMGLVTYVLATKREIFLVGSTLLLSVILLLLMGLDLMIGALDGAILIAVYGAYLMVLFFDGKHNSTNEALVIHPRLMTWLKLIAGLVIITFSAELTVNSAANLAVLFELPQSVVAVMIIGPGTSLPEFAISLRAVLSKRNSLSIGNILGSNVFDTLVPIGAAALISPVLIQSSYLEFDLPGLFVLTSACLFFLVYKRGIQKIEALIILSLYFSYLIFKVF